MKRTIYIARKSFIKVKPGMIGIALDGVDEHIKFILFENGDFDGFSPDDIEMFCYSITVDVSVPFEYQFKNVIQLDLDFSSGVFDQMFNAINNYIDNKQDAHLIRHIITLTGNYKPPIT